MYLKSLAMQSNYKKLGQYIRPVDVRNKECVQENLLGVSTRKVFIESIANTVGTDFKKYSIGKPELEGKPYKSSGGEMVYCDELEQDIPKCCRGGQLGDILELQRGFDLPAQNRVTGRSGSLGDVFYVNQSFWPLNTTLWVKNFKHSTPLFAYFTLKSINLLEYNSGSAVPTLNRNHVHMHKMSIPTLELINYFERNAESIFKFKGKISCRLKALEQLKEILLTRVSLEKEIAA